MAQDIVVEIEGDTLVGAVIDARHERLVYNRSSADYR